MPTRRTVAAGLAAASLAAPAAVLGAVEKAARPLRLLILGGTGFIGPHQVDYALARGHQVTLFNRGRAPHPWPGKVEELFGDRNANDLASLKGREWDACIDNPTTLPFWVRDMADVLAGHVGRYLFISTISVYASESKSEDETAAVAPYKGADPMAETQTSIKDRFPELYGPLKAVSEAEARRRYPGKAIIIRPGLIVGPGDETDRFTYWPARMARGGDMAAPGDGSDPVQIIDARDLAAWTVRMAEAGDAGTYNATGPAQTLTMAQMLQTIGGAVGGAARPVWLPTAFLDAQKISAWGDMPAWVPGTGETYGFGRRRIDRALRSGLTFRPLRDTAADTLAWFRGLPLDRQAHLRAGLTQDRESALLTAWRSHAG